MISWTLCRQRLYRLRIPLQPIAFRCDVMSRVPKSSIYKISAAHLHMCFSSKSYLASKGTKGDEGRNKMLMWWFLYVCETSDGCSWCWRLQCGTFVAKQAGEFRTTSVSSVTLRKRLAHSFECVCLHLKYPVIN